MKSLLIRFFVSFWLIIGITIGIAALGGYWYAERLRNVYENFESGDAMLDASAALASAGRDGLTVWLKNYPEVAGARLLVLDRHGNDLLKRPVPRMLRERLSRHRRALSPRDSDRRDPANLRRAQPLSQLVGPNGEPYTFVLIPTRGGIFVERGVPARGVLLLLAVVVSAAVSLLLARRMSRPVQRLRSATMSLADGNFDSRVASSVSSRKDELGLLARDFDVMADNLQRSVAQQTELSRNISHELRSPLARLRVALELARRKTDDLPEFDRIDHEAERLDSLIAQILSYTRLESVAEQDKQMTSLNDLIADVVDDVNYECKSGGIEGVSVVTDFSESIEIRLHVESVRGAIENIVRNAVRHTRDNSRVSVKLRQRPDGGATIVVSDSGPGVAERELADLFEPFFRAAPSATTISGTGLGLAIAKRAVQLHHGTIRADNRSDGGLEITAELPG